MGSGHWQTGISVATSGTGGPSQECAALGQVWLGPKRPRERGERMHVLLHRRDSGGALWQRLLCRTLESRIARSLLFGHFDQRRLYRTLESRIAPSLLFGHIDESVCL